MGDNPTEVEAPGALDFTALGAKVDDLAAKFAEITLPPREVVPAGHAQVTEPLPYRFDGVSRGPEGHDFSADLINGLFRGDAAARQRLEGFLNDVDFGGQSFAATASTDVAALNPSRYRPDLYVDQIQATTPVLDAIYLGGLADSTPFVVPKFGTATNYVADHTEGTEPGTAATFTATSQTITPSAVSGLGEITREVVDAGGNPKVSALLWTQFTREYTKAVETKAAAFLNGLTLTELGVALDLSDDDPQEMAAKVEAAIAGLVWIDGGDSFTRGLLPQDIWTPVTGAKDLDGRPLYPVLSPSNANGTIAERYRRIDIAGFPLLPAKSLGTTSDKGYVFDPTFGGVWHSGAKQIALPETVAKGYRVGIFGYVASAALNLSKIRKVSLVA